MADTTNDPKSRDPEVVWLERLATLLDNQFSIPFTSMRFGLDSLIGLVPGVGDFAGFVISGGLMAMMVKKGGSVWLVLRMLGNTLVDAAIGLIPVLGDFFDFAFKANRRNVELLKNYYASVPPEKRSSGRLAVAVVAFLGFVGLGFLMFGLFKMMAWMWSAAAGLFG